MNEHIAEAPQDAPREAPQDARQETRQEISKKELLQETGISYGQLYRWKREGLIPEEWFEKRSAFTGQETFFPRRLICERIEIIQSKKDELSLSDIKDLLDSLPMQSNLRQTLLATGSMDETFINSLEVDLEGIWLSAQSVKAVAILYVAMNLAKVSITEQSTLISQVIKTLSVEVPATATAQPAIATTTSAATPAQEEKG
ncbi:MAG: YhbD family protein [Coriobacteriia bacterium]|nr:YhbD family protein [Coriobacteriia bacterium]